MALTKVLFREEGRLCFNDSATRLVADGPLAICVLMKTNFGALTPVDAGEGIILTPDAPQGDKIGGFVTNVSFWTGIPLIKSPVVAEIDSDCVTGFVLVLVLPCCSTEEFGVTTVLFSPMLVTLTGLFGVADIELLANEMEDKEGEDTQLEFSITCPKVHPTAGWCNVNFIFFSTAWVKSAGKAGMLTEAAVEGTNSGRDDCPVCGRPDTVVATDGRAEHDNAVVFGTRKV